MSVNAASLVWDGVTDIAGYEVLYGTSSRKYTKVHDNGGQTSTAIEPLIGTLSQGQTYYFAVRSYDAGKKAFSRPSREVTYALAPKVSSAAPMFCHKDPYYKKFTTSQARNFDVRAGWSVDHIGGFGGSGGMRSSINLQDGEYLTRMSGKCGAWILTQITFYSNLGTQYGPYGEGRDSKLGGTTSGRLFNYEAPEGKYIGAFAGSADNLIRSIGPVLYAK